MKRWLLTLLILAVQLEAASALAQELVLEDECVLELDLPDGATVEIDGNDYGSQKRIVWKNLATGTQWESWLTARFENGESLKRMLLLKSGLLVRMPLRSDRFTKPTLALQMGHHGSIDLVAFSPDDRRLLTGSRDRTAKLWNATSGRLLRTFEVGSELNAVAFSPDGRQILIAANNAATLWSASSGRDLAIPAVHDGDVTSVAFSPDGRRILTGSKDGTAVLWEASSGRRISTFEGHKSEIQTVSFSSNGQQVLTGSRDTTAILWDASSGRRLRSFEGHGNSLYSVVFGPRSRQVVTASDDGMVTLWDAISGRRLKEVHKQNNRADSSSFSPRRRVHLSERWFESAIAWDEQNGPTLRTLAVEGEKAVSIAFSNNGQLALTGSSDGKATLWDVGTGSRIQTLENSVGAVSCVAFSGDGKHLVTGSKDTTATLWDAAKGRVIGVLKGHNDAITSVAYSPNGKWVLTGSGDDTAILWDLPNGRRISTLKGHTDDIRSVAVSSDGRLLLTGSLDGTARLWDSASGRFLRSFGKRAGVKSFLGRTGGVESVAFSPDDKRVLTGSTRLATLWDVENAEQIRAFPLDHLDDGSAAESVAFSPDGRRILVGSGDWAVIWEVSNGKRLRRISAGRHSHVRSVAFSPDGRQVLIGALDGRATLHDANSGDFIRQFTQHSDGVTSVAFRPDGRHVMTGSRDCTSCLWSVATGDHLATLISDRNGWLATTPEGLFAGSSGGMTEVCFRIGDGLNVKPAEYFEERFHYPGLLAAIWRGERPMPKTEIGLRLPPTLRIIEPTKGGATDEVRPKVVVEATDQGGGIAPIRLMHNGVRVASKSPPVRDGDKLRQTYYLSLVQGQNRLEFQSSCDDGSWDSEPATITFNYARSQAKPDLYVLAAGINRYAKQRYNLRFAANDAQSMVRLFSSKGRDLYAKRHVKLLLDEEATEANIERALRGFAETSRVQDTIIVFLSGHGALVGDRYHFLPHEYRTQPTISLEDDIKRDGLSEHEINDLLDSCEARKRLLIYDTCQTQMTQQGGKAVSQEAWIERLIRNRGTHAIMAVQPGEQATEHEELGHGLLSYVLLAAAGEVDRGPLATTRLSSDEPFVTVRDWFGYAELNLPVVMKKYQKRETDPYIPVSEGAGFAIFSLDR